MNITIIGTGNVGTVLMRLLNKQGHSVTQISPRAPGSLKQNEDLFIVAVADDHLLRISEWMPAISAPVVHTAGSVAMEILDRVSSSYGVFYPLQTIRKEISRLPEIPFLVDASSAELRDRLFQLALSVSGNAVIAGNEERRKFHLAAVIMNNFTNHLYALGQEYCAGEGIDFAVLQPLLKETSGRLQHSEAKDLQTGPAVRNDMSTIQKQRDMLVAYPALLSLYDAFTKSIISFNDFRSS